MPTGVESVCCMEVHGVDTTMNNMELDCITNHPGYQSTCLNRWALEVSANEFVEENGPVGDEEPLHE